MTYTDTDLLADRLADFCDERHDQPDDDCPSCQVRVQHRECGACGAVLENGAWWPHGGRMSIEAQRLCNHTEDGRLILVDGFNRDVRSCDECARDFTTAPVTNPDGPDARVWCTEDCMANTGERQEAGAA
jgi:hypothetical protein